MNQYLFRFARGIESRSVLALLSVSIFTFSLQAAQLEEVVVTAQKRVQSENDIGISMTTWTGDEIRDMGVASAEDMGLNTPGLTVNEAASTGIPVYTIRGVGFQDYSAGASSTVGIYFDEVALPYAVMTRGLVFDAARVEVLKGPQGDLYGRNTTGGQINFISNAPTDSYEAGIIAGYGRYKTLDLEGFVSGPIGDAVKGRLAFKTIQSSEGWQKSVTDDDELGEKDVTAVKGSLDIQLGEGASMLLRAQYVKDKSENRAVTAYDGRLIGKPDQFFYPYKGIESYLGSGETPPWYSTNDNEKAGWTNSYTSPITGKTWDLRPQRDNELVGVSARIDWAIGDMNFTSITAYSGFEREEANDWDGGFYNDSSNINTTDLDVFSQEFRLSGATESVDWLVGAYFSSDEVDEYYHYFMSDSVYGEGSVVFGVPPFNLNGTGILTLDTKYTQETESQAIFGHVEWQFAEQFRLTLGGRYTKEERDWSGCTFVADDNTLGTFLNTLFGTTVGPGHCGTIDDIPTSPTFILGLLGTPNANDGYAVYTDTIDTSRFMGKIGLDYMPSDDLLFYGTISQGFKSGGFNGANSNSTTQLIPYKEEVLTSFEIGTKATLLDGAMQLNASIFHYDYEDKQETDFAITLVGPISGLSNIDESTVKGAELDLDWLVNDGFRLALNVAWLDTEVDKWQATDPASVWLEPLQYVDASGSELPQAPELSYTALASYEWSLENGMMMEVAADISYTDETTGGVLPENATEDYTVANARISIGDAGGNWRTMLWVRNLADEDYYPSAFWAGNGPFGRSMGMPRTYGVTFSYFIGQ
jgi:iron complex outermembrane receptor protein